MHRKLGFTLIEILVVVTIISILAAVLYASFGEARQDSQNKALFTEIKETQLALELYKAQFGQYPAAQDIGVGGCSDNSGGIESAGSVDCVGNDYIVGLTPEFLPELPDHTVSDNPNCEFVYQVDDTEFDRYKLTAVSCYAGADTVADGVQWTNELARCPTTCGTCTSGTIASTSPAFYESFAVYSAGAECI